MINGVEFEGDKVVVNYSLENGGYNPLVKKFSIAYTISQVRELPIYTGPCNAGQTGGWSWSWYEDVVLFENLGLRFAFDVRETSDDFYDESVNIFHYVGQSCEGVVMTETVTDSMYAPPSRNRVWRNNVYSDERSSDSPFDFSLIIDINDTLKKYLAKHPEKLYELTPRRFEMLIADLLRDLGFETELTVATRDGGCDIYAYVKNLITSFLILVECKRWSKKKVGIDAVQRVYGAVKSQGAHKGMIVTTSFFTKPAQDERTRVSGEMELKDFNDLKSWLQQYDND